MVFEKIKLVNKMKQIVIVLFSIAVLISCKKKMEHNNIEHKMLNINYPAAYVVNGQGNNISVINLNTDQVQDVIDLNGAKFPHHIYLSPDKKWLAVAITSTDLSQGHSGHSGNTVSGYKIQIINSTTGMVEHEIPLSKMPHNAIFSPDGKELWLAQPDTPTSKIHIYSTSTWNEIAFIESGENTSEVTLSADGKWFCVANTGMNGTAMMFYPDQKKIQCSAPTGSMPVGVWPGTAKYSYVDNEESKTISEFDLDGDTISATINLGFKPGYIAYRSNGEMWVSDATNGKVVYFERLNNIWTKSGETITGSNAHAIAFNTTETKAYITNQDDDNVTIIDMSNHTVIKTINVGSKPNGIVFKN
ncbi:MAG TPA: YncE family protein [Bacteroidia bacterium]